MNHKDHVETNEFFADCRECMEDLTAIDWMIAVRKFGIEKANELFPLG